jgi:hypothetical protein
LLGIVTYFSNGLLEAKKNLVKLRNDENTIQAQLNQASNKAQAIAQTGNLIEECVNHWNNWSFDKKRSLVTMLVDSVDIAEVSSHVLQIRVYFNDVLNYAVMDGYMFRNRGSRELWTDEENALLRRLYKDAEKSVLLSKLPTRSFDSIHVQANTLELTRKRMPADIAIPDDMCYKDYEVMQTIGMDATTRKDVWHRNHELERAYSEANVHKNHAIPLPGQKRDRAFLAG